MNAVVSLLMAVTMGAAAPAPREADIAWVTSGEFCEPETVLPLPDDTLLVSNVCDFRQEGNGFLSLLDSNGQVLDWRVVDGLDAPLGMALWNERLYVVNANTLKIFGWPGYASIDTIILNTRVANDVAVGNNGEVYVSDTAENRVILVGADGAQTVFTGKARFNGANGIAIDDGFVYVGGERLWRVDRHSLSVETIGPDWLRDIDGIEIESDGTLQVTPVGGPLVRIRQDGDIRIFAGDGVSSANHGFSESHGLALIPTGFDNTVIAIRLKPGPAKSGVPAKPDDYGRLVNLLDEFLQWKDPRGNQPHQIIRDAAGQVIEPVPDYGDTALQQQRSKMQEFQARIDAIDPSAWSRSRQVDYLAVRSRLNRQDFLLNRFRPWSRDPGYYVDRMLRVAFTDLPVQGDDEALFLSRLRAIPVLVTEARSRLDEVAADYADLAIHNLTHADGVGHGYPYRATPPAGVLGWYDDLLERAAVQPGLVPEIQAARVAIASFHEWLVEARPGWTAPAGVGKAAFDWYLKHVKLMPWDSDQLVVLGRRELDRLWSEYALERHRNRHLVELLPAADAAEYQQRIDATDAHIRTFLADQDIITVPDDIGELDTNAPWIVRPGGRNFWEEIQFRDPHPDHLHAVIPGHRFDGIMAARDDHPVRSKIYSASRVEGWATYLEEAMLQAGLFAELPRVRELIQIFGIFRAARVPADVWLQKGEKGVRDVVDYWLERVPYLDKDVARVDAEIYLRRPPGYGIGYTIGTLQMQRLLADVKRLQGDAFDLKRFHDTVMQSGRIPLSLLRWEMTGLDDEVRHFWQREPVPADQTGR